MKQNQIFQSRRFLVFKSNERSEDSYISLTDFFHAQF